MSSINVELKNVKQDSSIQTFGNAVCVNGNVKF